MSYIAIIFFCLFIAVYDLITMRIPDIFLIVFSITMIIVEENIFKYLTVSHFASFAFSFLIFGTLWRCTGGIGFGDVKLASILGFFLGMENIIYAFFITACLGILIYFLGIFIFKLSRNIKIPYAPFLCAGTLFAVGSIT